MNAYELADEVQNLMYRKIGDVDFDDVADMLRKQAKIIEELQAQLLSTHHTYVNKVLRTYDGKRK